MIVHPVKVFPSRTLLPKSNQLAWKLADGTRNQTAIAKESGMSKGNTSTFFKSLRELGGVTDSSTPSRTVEVG